VSQQARVMTWQLRPTAGVSLRNTGFAVVMRFFISAIVEPGRPLLFVLTLLFAAVFARAETEIRSLSPVIDGHSVGGVTVDLVGNIYVADFGDLVWKITVEGQREVFASGLYGASGNAIDGAGDLLQSNCYNNSVIKIDRKGQAKLLATSGLSCPVGLAINKQSGDIYVANCSSDSIAKIASDGTVSSFAKSDLFKCPNGISFDREENLYVVNFRDNKMLKIDAKGVVTLFAAISEKGLGHLCFKEDRFYVAASESHEIYEVTLDKTVKRILGNGERGIVDGAGAKARLSFPNGVACHPWVRRLYINELVNESVSGWPQRAIIREIILEAK
jgi:DNA-binding beta-propeller fold protein YncE